MEISYVICHGQSADGTPWTAVVKYVGSVAIGADHHWLRSESAQRAKEAYEAGTVAFPITVGEFMAIP